VSYILWVFAAPAVLTFLGSYIFKKRAWVIVIIEIIAIMFLTFVGIIENNPMGNMQRQLSSYFGNITNDFYLKYLPLVVMTMIFIRLFKKTNKIVS